MTRGKGRQSTDFAGARVRYATAALGICLLVHLLFMRVAVLKQLELNSLDVLYRRRPPIEVLQRLGTVDIDANTIELAGSWPISRRFYGEFIRALRRYDAALMSLDVFFPDPSPLTVTRGQLLDAAQLARAGGDAATLHGMLSRMSVGADDELARAVKDTGLAVLGQTFNFADPATFRTTAQIENKTRSMIENALSEEHRRSLAMAKRFSVPFDCPWPGNNRVARAYFVEPPIPRILEHAKGLGFAQIIQDEDGTVRKYPLFMHYDGRLYPSLVMMGISLLTGAPLESMKVVPGKHVLVPGARGDITIPVDKYLRMLVNWAGDYADTFAHIPATLLLQFRAIDVMREHLRAHAGDPGGLVAKGYDAAIRAVLERQLLPAGQAEEKGRTLLLASLAEAELSGGGDRASFLEAYAGGGGDEAAREGLARVWDQVSFNRRALDLVRADTDISYDKVKARLGIPDEQDMAESHAVEALRFIAGRGKDPELWAPLYFFPPERVPLGGGGRTVSISPLDLADKVLYVGLTATATHDYNPMPFSPRYPMVGLHVNAANTILTGQFIREVPAWAGLLIALACALLLAMVTPHLHPLAGSGFFLGVTGAYIGFAYISFARLGLWLPVVAPSVTVVTTYIVIVTHKFLLEQREKRRVRSAFSTYVAPAVVNEVLRHPEMLRLGGERREMTVSFGDLWGFTAISERSSPEELVRLLNEYFDAMTDAVFRHGGTLDKYEGDGIMAFWGAPMADDDHAYHCCCTALDSMHHLETVLRPKWTSEGKPLLRMRIGINSGPMIVGNMGSVKRMDYTVTGDAVNLAARLEAANKQYGTAIMISEHTRKGLAGRLVDRELDSLRVVGKHEPVRIYEVLGRPGEVSAEKNAIVAAYNEGLTHYKARDWRPAVEAFSAAVSMEEEDGPSRTYLDRCRRYLEDPPPPDWDGVWVLTSK